jgi:DEAD/DEAH box helicase domain-containing protein
MLPPILSREIETGVADFLRTSFPPANPLFEGMLEAFLAKEDTLFKGPYFSLKLPFRQGSKAPDKIFNKLALPFPPYKHQEKAFDRLKAPDSQSTLVATGTGSGKTECFLYPILDYCLQNPEKRGIKAILIYPMNALATDQARRLAQLINESPNAKGNVRAGLFIGGESGNTTSVMTEESVITAKDTLRDSPPDILLTNYKMLDLLMIRPDDKRLWNLNEPDTLKYLVVDELHTFDGAQGTDLACLIRRLKRRLRTPEESLCCVGTSATLGSDEELDDLTEYAQAIFGEPFAGKGAVVTEDLLTDAEFVAGRFIKHTHMPEPGDREKLNPGSYKTPEDYLGAQYRLWFQAEPPPDVNDEGWRVQLGEDLREHSFFRNLLLFFRDGLVNESKLLHELSQMDKAFEDKTFAKEVIDSLISLASLARNRLDTGLLMPFVQVRSQLWLRELSRLVASVERPPTLRFSDDLKEDASRNHLPVVHCRDCGSTGWGSVLRPNEDVLGHDIKAFYKAFFGSETKLCFIYPDQNLPAKDKDGQQELFDRFILCGECLRLLDPKKGHECTSCGNKNQDKLIPVLIDQRSRRYNNVLYSDKSCRYCGSGTGVSILGSRAASLTSVSLEQGFASPYNDDKKALTFSDNVQDASHRAGFYKGRTYNTHLRTAIRSALEAYGDSPPTLPEFTEHFTKFWRKELGEEYYIGAFIHHKLEYLNDFEALAKTGKIPSGSNLGSQIDSRLSWEICSEFGFKSRVGRTLEKTSASILALNLEALKKATERALKLFNEEAGGFGELKETTIQQTLLGLTTRLRCMGGIHHPELNGYVQQEGNTYVFKNRIYMPSFWPPGNSPKFFTTGSGRVFERLIAAGTGKTWSQRWIARSLSRDVPGAEASVDTAIPLLVEALSESGLWKEVEIQQGKVWGIDQAMLTVEKSALQFICNACGFGHSGATPEATYWNGLPCLRHECTGHYEEQKLEKDYFGDLYRFGDVSRIRPAEHTGLLERDSREDTERRFMAEPAHRLPADPNLLSCTPTLEMGIDIGQLSSVILSSVPPAQANYLQRIGRAGRRDGNAFNLTLANANAHDLYFWADPKEMMAGKVAMPGVFLDAPAVLERQFTAYCFDRWIESSEPPPVIPYRLNAVLDNLEGGPSTGRFPYNLLTYVDTHVNELMNGFLEMFGEELQPDSQVALRGFGSGRADQEGGLAWKMIRGLEELRNERADLRDRLRKTTNAISRNKRKTPRDEALEEELKELQRSRAGLYELADKINKKNTYNYFTDEGLLPNYAFPEEGVTLHSIILKKKPKPDEHGAYEAIPYDYERPAAMAIRELAPGNSFYAGGRKQVVDQISMGLSPIEDWHFCNNCDHLEQVLEGGPQHSNCPKCDSSGWADISLIRPMLRIKQVIAKEFDNRSRSFDEKDEREPEFFNRHSNAHYEDSAISKAYEIKSDLPFGFEFIRRVTLREVNLGKQDEGGAQVTIAGRDISAPGFSLCPECGKVDKAKNNKPVEHDLFCSRRGKEGEGDLLNTVFLYRELKSEAIRLLIPSRSSSDETSIYSFISALYVGLKEKFGGSIDHLEACIDERPIPGTSIKQRYLILYDKVPGGTGYLKQLTSSAEAFLSVLDLALKEIKTCTCESDPMADGCHRCILGYRMRHQRQYVSRQCAIQILESILKEKDSVIEIDNLSAIRMDPLVESELELRFLEWLRSVEGFRLEPKIVRGKPGYLLRAKTTLWEIAQQIEIPGGGRVTIPSRPDFIMYPLRSRDSKPIAVFLDGFAFHADESAGNNRIGLDLGQRRALSQSDIYHTWSLTWKDLQHYSSNKRDYFWPYGEENAENRKQSCRKFSGSVSLKDYSDTKNWSSPDFLRRYLESPSAETMAWVAFHYAFFTGDPTKVTEATAKQVASTITSRDSLPTIQSAAEGDWMIRHKEYTEGDLIRATIVSWVPLAELEQKNVSALRCIFRFNDDQELNGDAFQKHWEGLLRFSNILQFLPSGATTSLRGYDEGNFPSLSESMEQSYLTPSSQADSSSEAAQESESSHSDEIELVAPNLREILQALDKAGKWPKIGFELVNNTGRVCATGELAWEDEKVVVLSSEQSPIEKDAFEKAGWTVLNDEDAKTLTSELVRQGIIQS